MNYPEAYFRFDKVLKERKESITIAQEVSYREILSSLYSIKNWEVVEIENNKLTKTETVQFPSFLLKSGDNYFFYRSQVKYDGSLSFNWHKEDPFTMKMDLFIGNKHLKFSRKVGTKPCYTNSFFNTKLEAIEDIEMRTGILLKKMMPLLKYL